MLYHFSFLIMINPMNSNWQKSTAFMNPNGTVVISINLHQENIFPPSIFCLKNLQSLKIVKTPFLGGKTDLSTDCHYLLFLGVVPDDLGNLEQLHTFDVTNTRIKKMTEQLGTLANLYTLTLNNCSLAYLPNLSGNTRLRNVYLPYNQLSRADGLTNVRYLSLDHNMFSDIPTLGIPEALQILYMDYNPLKNMLAITSCANLQSIFLRNTNLSSIPAIIDRLQKLQYLYLSNNKLFYLPSNMLKLTSLKYLNIQRNLFSPADILTIKMQFNASLPNMTLIS